MLRLLTFLSALFLASAAAATSLWVDAPRDGYLNLRTGPSVQYHVLGKMPHGSPVKLLEAPGKWVKVRHVSGLIGWAHSGFLTDHKPVLGHDRDPGYSRGQDYWIDAPRFGHLNLRNGPGQAYQVIEKMPHGAKAHVIYKQDGWYKLRFEGKTGWANSRFLSEHKVKTRGHNGGHAGTPYAQPTGQHYWVYAPGYGGLNLRNGPGTGYPVLFTMGQRDKVAELGRQGDWILLRHPSGYTGWAHGDYLVKQDPGHSRAPNGNRYDHRDDRRKGGRDRDGDWRGDTGHKDYGHNDNRRKGKKGGKTFDSFAEAVAACAGHNGNDLQVCLARNISRIR
ncbi:SH3 domain-containing protein [Antarctobacter sp.]|uniref:SH3 domain-containing protein n=1 Tax=Antarctobacter sp. TaxID=1872577 RepID=UPI003A8D35FA